MRVPVHSIGALLIQPGKCGKTEGGVSPPRYLPTENQTKVATNYPQHHTNKSSPRLLTRKRAKISFYITGAVCMYVW